MRCARFLKERGVCSANLRQYFSLYIQQAESDVGCGLWVVCFFILIFCPRYTKVFKPSFKPLFFFPLLTPAADWHGLVASAFERDGMSRHKLPSSLTRARPRAQCLIACCCLLLTGCVPYEVSCVNPIHTFYSSRGYATVR